MVISEIISHKQIMYFNGMVLYDRTKNLYSETLQILDQTQRIFYSV